MIDIQNFMVNIIVWLILWNFLSKWGFEVKVDRKKIKGNIIFFRILFEYLFLQIMKWMSNIKHIQMGRISKFLPRRRLVSESFEALLPDGSSASSSISGKTICCLLSGILEKYERFKSVFVI